jgi:hypothetical protein
MQTQQFHFWVTVGLLLSVKHKLTDALEMILMVD